MIPNRVAAYDLLAVQRASDLIVELDAELGALLQGELGASERLRLLRKTTNEIVRTANDAVRAYSRARRAIDVELARQNGNVKAATEMRQLLRDARSDVLRALELAKRRYPGVEQPSDVADAGDRPARLEIAYSDGTAARGE